jgi:drug/metabolite transporter (DMT)-like permease
MKQTATRAEYRPEKTTMLPARILLLTAAAMIAFAGNSLLCRLALKNSGIDATSFTTIRLISGAAMLWLIVRWQHRPQQGQGSWLSACALFVYAAAFSYAYVVLPTATGALLLFGTVQATMIGYGLYRGEQLRGFQFVGLSIALGGLASLLLPGLAAPSLAGAAMMISAGIAWGIYSLRGKSAGDPTRVSAGNFLRAAVIAVAASLFLHRDATINLPGFAYAVASGAITSGIGYAIWYTALPMLKATHAASVQLSVPVIAALGGIVMLGEPLTWRLIVASVAILGGIALVIAERNAVSVSAPNNATEP